MNLIEKISDWHMSLISKTDAEKIRKQKIVNYFKLKKLLVDKEENK